MSSPVKFSVKASHHQERLQNFLKDQLKEHSGKSIKKMIDNYACKVNGKVEVFSSRKVMTGDQIEISLAEQEKKSNPNMAVIFENENYYICNKGPNTPCEDELIQNLLKNKRAKLVHRLDKDTTGLLIVAKDSSSQKAFEEIFRKKEIQKTYLAISQGVSKKRFFSVNNLLKRKVAYQGQSIWGRTEDKEGLLSTTHFEVLEISNQYTLFSCQPITGRTHQIRVHLCEAGFPILGDMHYGREAVFTYKAPRVLLHAVDLKFQDPFTNQMMHFKAPTPPDFNKAKKLLFKSCM